jgi:hypothetical protein
MISQADHSTLSGSGSIASIPLTVGDRAWLDKRFDLFERLCPF